MSSVNPEIRPARIGDAAAVTACVSAAYRHYIERIGKPPAPMLEDYEEIIREHQVFVLTTRTQVVGVLVLTRQEQNVLLDNVAVYPEYQGKGFGRKLIAKAEEETRRLGCTSIVLYTHERMIENIKLYEKLGFVETERKVEQGYQRIYMRKSLRNEIA